MALSTTMTDNIPLAHVAACLFMDQEPAADRGKSLYEEIERDELVGSVHYVDEIDFEACGILSFPTTVAPIPDSEAIGHYRQFALVRGQEVVEVSQFVPAYADKEEVGIVAIESFESLAALKARLDQRVAAYRDLIREHLTEQCRLFDEMMTSCRPQPNVTDERRQNGNDISGPSL